ncbi:MAG: glycosyltransferase [Candidatus Kapaibacterium sp.]
MPADLIFYIQISIILLLFLLISITAINALAGPFLKKKHIIEKNKAPKVSVLVPARDEENNIRGSYGSLKKLDYPDYEVIWLDDNSSDSTYEIISNLTKNQENFRVIKGKPLPEGWLGKNWACMQLAEASNGDILVFTDADNRHEPHALTETVHKMEQYRLDMLSAFPRQKTGTLAEKLILPMIDLILYSMLVLWSTLFAKHKMFAAANGQWIAFRKEAYFAHGGHELVKNEVVEDVAFSSKFKSHGRRILTCSGIHAVEARMYHSFGEVWQGLGKNLFGIAGFSVFNLAVMLGIIGISGLGPFILAVISPDILSAIALALLFIWKGLLALRFKNNFPVSVFLHPISVALIIALGINSYYLTKSGKISWKGRNIKPEL